jgi:hypothetical protein
MRNLYHTHEDRDRNEQHLPAETILKKEGDRDGEMRGEPRGRINFKAAMSSW